jgi:hypothetical protein
MRVSISTAGGVFSNLAAAVHLQFHFQQLSWFDYLIIADTSIRHGS